MGKYKIAYRSEKRSKEQKRLKKQEEKLQKKMDRLRGEQQPGADSGDAQPESKIEGDSAAPDEPNKE